jgi:phosphate transport system substrate-binding protein
MPALRLAAACAFVAICFGLGACGSASVSAGALIVIDGSSTVHPVSVEMAAEFRKTHPQQAITVGSSSTGVGLKRFCAGELDIADASRPITADEVAACAAAKIEFVEVPIAHDAICIAVNPANTWARSITVAELKTLWEPTAEGRVTTWRQVRADWPDRDIHLVGPDRDSGTFDFFNEAITGSPKDSRKDYAGHVDDTLIIDALQVDELALGYVGFTYCESRKDKVRALAVDDLDERIGPGAIEFTLTNVRRGVYRPLSRPLLTYVRASSLDRPEVQQFVDFYTRYASEIVERSGGVRLTARESELALARVTTRVKGTMFGPTGDEDDVSLQMRLSRLP